MPHGVDRHGPVGLCLSCRHLQRQTVIEKRRVAWKQKSNVSRGSEKFDEKSRVSRSPRENFVQFYFVWWLLLRTMLGQRFTNPEKSKVKSLSCTLRAWRIIMQISRRLKITPGEKFAFLFFFFVFFFLRSSTKYTPWRSAKAKREGRRFAEKSHYFQRVCDVFRDERGPEKKLQFFKRKIVTAENRVVPQSVSLSCNYHVFPRLEQPLQGVSLSRTHAKRRLPGKLLPGFRMKE